MGSSGSMAQLLMDMIAACTTERVPLTTDAVVWHNNDAVEMPATTGLANLAALRRALPDVQYEDVRVFDCGSVSVAQSVFTATLPSGTVVRAPVCAVVHERDGRIARVEEYADSAQFAPIVAALNQQTSLE